LFIKTLNHMKRYGWIWGLVSTTALGAGGVWVNNVNATAKDVVELKVLLPEINNTTKDTRQAVNSIKDDISEVKERVANIEGRLSKK
jgi:outer membrane murein-binding lipoprotein Lpp